jgi:DNA-binding NtrC family response regulator
MFPEGKQVLLADDPAPAAESAALLRSLGLQVVVVTDPDAALEQAVKEGCDLAMLAVRFAGERPGALVGRLKAAAIPSVVLLADPDEARRAIASLAEGVDDYLLKPLDRNEVQTRVGRILVWQDLDARVLRLQDELFRKYYLGNVVARSEGMRRVRESVLQVAAARSTVLILGESGVGKELVAKAIHYNSPRRDAPFIAINCAAIPAGLIESDLFGHERGAFTGAVERRKGKFELAHGGTILLDEIGEMDLQTQVKLLRVLEEREFMRVGGVREVKVDVRVLAATNNDLEDLVARRSFREDLYFRLKVITIPVPPLRDRVEDIPDLARLFMQQVCSDNGLSARKLSAKAVRVLQRYSWPGNVRELKNVLESTIITRPGELIRSADLPAALRDNRGPQPRLRVRAGASLSDMERALIRRTLVHLAGNRTHAARTLEIGVRTLQRKMRAYKIRVPFTRPRRSGAGQRSTETPRPGSSSHGKM